MLLRALERSQHQIIILPSLPREVEMRELPAVTDTLKFLLTPDPVAACVLFSPLRYFVTAIFSPPLTVITGSAPFGPVDLCQAAICQVGPGKNDLSTPTSTFSCLA